MVTPVVLLNLFVVPVVALWVHCKHRNIEPEVSIKFLMMYGLFVACNVPLTKIGIILARVLLNKDISIDSGYYTLLAIIAATLLPALLDKLRMAYANRTRLLAKVKALLTSHSMTYKQKLIISLVLVALIVIAYIIRKPLEIYVGNANEFLFVLSDFLPWLLLLAIVALATVSCLLAFLPDLTFRLASAFILWFGIASWFQDLFLNQKLSEVNGSPMDWSSLGALPEYNLMAWFFLLIGVLLLCIALKQKWFSFTQFVAGGLCIVQLVAVISVFINMPEQKKTELVISGEEQMQLASEENVIIFVLDYFNPYVMSNMLEQYPEASNIIKDFVNYDNANCGYYCTFPSFTHFLTGNEFDFEAYVEDWQKESWGAERCKLFYQKIKDSGYTCRLNIGQGQVRYVFGDIDNLVGYFDNIKDSEMRTNTGLLLHKLLQLSAYCCLPYAAKPPFEVLTPEFSNVVEAVDIRTPVVDNIEYYQRLLDERLALYNNGEKVFVVNYLFGLHPPVQLSANGTYMESGATSVDAMRGLFTILEEYFEQLKNLGLYDKSTIIIMGDHGDGTPAGYQAAFLLKQVGETHDCMAVNSAPVDYNDFQATILELIGENDGNFGTSFFDWNEDDQRRRVVYNRIFDDNSPTVKGSPWNRYHGYIYYRDFQELHKHIVEDKPDIIMTANKWRTAPW